MKRCPQCNRVDSDDALTFCRVDGTPLVRESGPVSEGAGTLRFGSAPVTGETETRILKTEETLNRPTAPTTVSGGRRPSGNTRRLGKPKSRGGVVITFAAVAAVALAASAYLYMSRDRGAAAKNSIAVLPFENASDDPDVEYLSDGISESLINSLSQLPNVRVLARSTMFRFKGQDADPQAVGKQLGVDTVLTGRVVQVGDSLNVQADLVDVADGSQLWGERYSRKATDILAVQEDIAREIVGKLRLRMSGEQERRVARRYTENPDAYQLYLKGRFYSNKRTAKDLRTAVDYFRQAIAADPDYVSAYTGLADAYTLLPLYGGAVPREVMPEAREAALKAMSLDEQSAEAHTSLGIILNFYDYDIAGAEREFKRAIELNPNDATAHQFYGNLLTHAGKLEQAFAEYRRALELDPLSLNANRLYGIALTFARRYEEAVTQLKKTLDLDAGFAPAHDSLANAYRLKGDYAASVEELARSQELAGEPQNAALMRDSFGRGGWRAFLRAMTGGRRPSNAPSYQVATFYAELGEKDEAFAELDKAYERREFFLNLLKVDPRLDPLRPDPRFADLMRRVGLPQ